MASALNETSSMSSANSIMTGEQYTLAEGSLCLVRGLIAGLGVAANVLNVKTFISMGLRDGITVCFMSLALSDLAYLVTVISRAVSFAFMTVETASQLRVWFPVEPYGVYIYFGHAGRIPYIMSNITTTFLAVVRCLCVAKPILFKNMFGRKITLFVLMSSAIFSIGSYLPVLIYMGMTQQRVPGNNVTRPTLWISPKREEVKDIVWAIRDAFVPFATQIIIIACLIVMTISLRSAGQFRQQFTQHLTLRDAHVDKDRATIGEVKGLSRKEFQVIQQVVVISTVYVICNTPTILVNFAVVYEPQFSIESLYRNLYLTVTGVKHLCQTVNSSFNIFIYYKFNSKYRKNVFSSQTVEFQIQKECLI